MLVAITGATGFIGRHLAELHLQRGDRVRVLKRASSVHPLSADVEAVAGDITVPGQPLRDFAAGADVLYHCAAEVNDERSMQAVNVDGTRNLVAAAQGGIGRWVQVSSVAVYGQPRRGTVTESSPVAPGTLYGRTKLDAENIVHAAAARGAFACSTLRPAIVFGCDMSSRLLFQLVAMIDRGWFFFIGDRGATMNYVHVASVASALVSCATSAGAVGKIYNLSETVTLEQFVEIIATTLDVKPTSMRLPESMMRLVAAAAGMLPGFPLTRARIDALTSRSVYSADRIADDLRYNPALSLEAGLREFVRHWIKIRTHAT